MRFGKKGVIEQLQPLVVALVAIGIILTVGFLIIAETRSVLVDSGQACANSTNYFNTSDNLCYQEDGTKVHDTSIAYNATHSINEALDSIPGWLSIIVIAFIGALLLGLVALFRARR